MCDTPRFPIKYYLIGEERDSVLIKNPLYRVKPKSLFAQASTKRLRGNEGLFGPKASTPSPDVDMGGL